MAGGRTPPAPLQLTSLRRQLLGDGEDAGEDRGPGAGAAGSTGWPALGVSGAAALPGGAAGSGLTLPVSPGRSAGRPATWPRRCWTARDTGCPRTSGPWAAPCKWGPGGWAGGAPGPAEQPDPPRYTALTGSPPFEAAHRQELYRRIRAARYPLPPHVSPRARALITRLLAPEPAARPSLRDVLDHGFFTQVWGQRGTRPPGTRQGQGGDCLSLPRASRRTRCHPTPAAQRPSL